MAGEKILIIEDEQDIAWLWATQMQGSGYHTVVACDGLRGLELALQEQPDLILLDLRLPQMSGMRLLYELEKHQVKTSVVVVTAWDSQELAVQALRLGVKDYLNKPVSMDELLEVVKRALREEHLRRERDALTERLLASNQQLEQRVRQLTSLHQVGQALAAILDLDEVLDAILNEACRIWEVGATSILLLDEQTGQLVFRSATGETAEQLIGMRLPPGEGIAGWVAEHGEPVLVSQVQQDERFASSFDQMTGCTTESILAAPLKIKGQIIGVLEVLNQPQAIFTEADKALLNSIAASAAIAIYNAGLVEDLRQRTTELAKANERLEQEMDPITTAVVAALAAGAASGATDVAKQAMVDAYNALKRAIKRKFGDDSKIVQAVADLESEPDFKPNQDALAGRVAQAKADQDREILAAAQALLDQIKAQPGGEKHIQQVIGSSYVAQADRGGTATVTVGQPQEPKK